MLTNSDNDIAEALARHTALAGGRPASFAGGGEAIATQLRGWACRRRAPSSATAAAWTAPTGSPPTS